MIPPKATCQIGKFNNLQSAAWLSIDTAPTIIHMNENPADNPRMVHIRAGKKFGKKTRLKKADPIIIPDIPMPNTTAGRGGCPVLPHSGSLFCFHTTTHAMPMAK